jgi:hypothetical protein
MCRFLPIFAFMCCLIILGCSQKREVVWKSGEDRLPQDWNPNDLAQAAQAAQAGLDKGGATAESHILIWQKMEDEYHRRVDVAIIWIRLEDGGQGSWMLANVYRRPRQPQQPEEWGLSVMFDTDQEVRKSFDHAPNNDDIREFLRDSYWVFGPYLGFRVLDSAVCAGTWKAVTGEEPMKFFEGPVK